MTAGLAEHTWVAAATVDLTDKQAALAQIRGSVRVREQVRIDVIEIYCSACRRPWDDVFDQPCVAVHNTEHLRGGPIGKRKKRAHDRHNCELLNCDPRAADEEDDDGEDEEGGEAASC